MFFLEIVLWSKRKGFANKKNIFIFKSENFAAHEPHARSQIPCFFGIGLIKIYLIGIIVPVFKNRKEVLSHSTLLPGKE